MNAPTPFPGSHAAAPHLSADRLTALAAEYEAGIASENALVGRYGLVGVAALRTLARAGGWVRGNLRGEIARAADAAALMAVGRELAHPLLAPEPTLDALPAATEPNERLEGWQNAAVERYAGILADITAQHRDTIKRGHAMTLALLGDLEQVHAGLPAVADLRLVADAVARGDRKGPKGTPKGAAADAVLPLLLAERARIVGACAETMRTLTTAAERWITMERAAFGMGSGKGGGGAGGGYEDALRSLGQDGQGKGGAA